MSKNTIVIHEEIDFEQHNINYVKSEIIGHLLRSKTALIDDMDLDPSGYHDLDFYVDEALDQLANIVSVIPWTEDDPLEVCLKRDFDEVCVQYEIAATPQEEEDVV